MLYLLIYIFLLFNIKIVTTDELFQSDIGEDMKIGISNSGYKSVKLKCGSNSMQVHLETDDDVDGVIYTRGSFHDKMKPCFLDPGFGRKKRSFDIKFNLEECKTSQKGDLYTNVLILQHDKELVMPGDAAFNLECDFSKPRDVTVETSFNKKANVISRISLTDADPGAKVREKRSLVESNDEVILTLQKARELSKIEL